MAILVDVVTAVISWIVANPGLTASLILTASLVSLYYQQKEILRVERLPEIEISSRTLEGDELEAIISNYGHELAKNVRFATTVHPCQEDQFEPILVESRARRVTNNSQNFERSLRPQEGNVKFRGNPSMGFEMNSDTHRSASFSTGFRQLSRNDVDSVWFQIFVVADDQLGGCQMRPLFWPARNPGDIAKELDLEDGRIDLKTAFDLGGMHDPMRCQKFSPRTVGINLSVVGCLWVKAEGRTDRWEYHRKPSHVDPPSIRSISQDSRVEYSTNEIKSQ